MPYLAELSPEWHGVDEKSISRKDLPQHKAFFRAIDKYGKTMPTQELLDAEFKAWKQQQATPVEQVDESELGSWLSSEDGKEEQASCQEKAYDTTP